MSVTSVLIQSGAVHIPEFLDLRDQVELARTCLRIAEDPAGSYQPVLRGRSKMRLRMVCLGRHWNAKRYIYQSYREDVDGRPVQSLPETLAAIARRAAKVANMRITPDIALVNFYDGDGRLGLHQDKDEDPRTLAAGVPVVSLSLGDDAEFIFGGTSRSDPTKKILLKSGDAFVFGGRSRMCYHGVRRILEKTGPSGLGLTGRVNITFRQY